MAAFRSIVTVPLIVALLAGPLSAQGLKARKLVRLAWLSPIPRSELLFEAFLDELRTLGRGQGRHFVVDRREPDSEGRQVAAIAAELVRLEPDVVVTGGTPNIWAFKRATREIPIVLGVAGDPVASGLVASLARPGGNVTGVTLIADYTMVGKHLHLLAEVTPDACRVAVLANPENATHETKMRELADVRHAVGVELWRFDARNPDELSQAFAAMRREGVQALLVLADAVAFQARNRIAGLALKNRLHAMFFLREHVAAGGLMSYAPKVADSFRRAAHYADKILNGAQVAELPIKRPSKFYLSINSKTAKALGLTIPPSVLLRADEIIEQ